MSRRARYQRPGGGGEILTEPTYRAPDEPTGPGSEIHTTADEAGEVAVPDVLPPPRHVQLGEAVPVRVVNFTRELDRLRQVVLYGFSIGPEQRITIPGRRNRVRIVLRCVTADATVRVSHDDGQVGGFTLASGQSDLEGSHQASLYVFNPDDTDTVDVSVMEETTIELK